MKKNKNITNKSLLKEDEKNDINLQEEEIKRNQKRKKEYDTTGKKWKNTKKNVRQRKLKWIKVESKIAENKLKENVKEFVEVQAVKWFKCNSCDTSFLSIVTTINSFLFFDSRKNVKRGIRKTGKLNKKSLEGVLFFNFYRSSTLSIITPYKLSKK